MDLKLRVGRTEDAEVCGQICYAAFAAIARQHNFPPDIPTPAAAIDLLAMLLTHPGFYSVVAEADGHVVGSNFLAASGLGPSAIALTFFGHTVGETNEDLKALMMAADSFEGPGILVPTSNAELFQWCLTQALRVVQPMTLMSVGLYTQPQGAYLPSIRY